MSWRPAEWTGAHLKSLLTKTRRTEAGCLEWTGQVDTSGYGRFRVHIARRRREFRVHRVRWEMEHGGALPSEVYVCHSCDNRLCVEIDHLFLGTHTENMADMRAKGRRVGIGGAPYKLTPHLVRQIRGRPEVKPQVWVDLLGVSVTTIYRILDGRE